MERAQIRYFRLNMKAAISAHQIVWSMQDAGGIQRSKFGLSSEAFDASTWTPDPNGEVLLRMVLQSHNIRFEEGDEQQVKAMGFGL